MKFDFSGYATKNNIKCTDGRTIRKDAFKHNDGQTVPLVWQHMHNSPDNILGHALLENREDGVYAYCKFNDTKSGKNAKLLVQHGDVKSLSIYANQLQQQGSNVVHGAIREVSLVLAGANPGAKIENVSFAHSDGSEDISEEDAFISYQIPASLEHGEIDTDDDYEEDDEVEDEDISHSDEETVQEIFDTLTDKQKTAVYVIVDQITKMSEKDVNHSDGEEGGQIMKHNVFENKNGVQTGTQANTLTHDQFQSILNYAQENNTSLKKAILAHATEYGIESIDVLFPDAKALSSDPTWLKREDDWVAGVLAAVQKVPFSRIKSILADMDFETARAKGYVKTTEKKEVYFKVSKRVVSPTTIYVKQKLDRDDIIDVVDFDIVAMVRFQLRTLLNEELAKAYLTGDLRDPDDEYKIDEECIRPIWKEDDMYAVKESLTTKTDYKKMVKEIALTHKRYKGSGSPVLYTTPEVHTNMLWIEDQNGRRIYESDATLCAALRVSKIVEVPYFEGLVREDKDGNKFDLVAIKVNLHDYKTGADKGGQVATFDDFDIDFNQYKYLMETRCSGSLFMPKSAQIYEFKSASAASTSEEE